MAAKKKPRVVPKVSPLKGTSVDAWAKKLVPWQAGALRLLRTLIERHAPTSTLAMKWGHPVWDHNGPLAWLKPAAKHLSIGFWRGAEMKDPGGRLEGTGDRMRHVKIASAAELKALPLETFVKQAVALNAAKGDKTKRK